MKLTLQLASIVHNAPTKFRDNLFKFTHIGVLTTTTTICGTITEPGLPVFKQCYIKHQPSISNSASVVQT